MKSVFKGKKISLVKFAFFMMAASVLIISLPSCSSQRKQEAKRTAPEKISYTAGDGPVVEIEFLQGRSHNHPLMVFWIEDESGGHLQTLYVAESIGTGIFGHGKVTKGNWEPGPVSRPAALPFWWHKYGFLPTPDRQVPDAITGPTPEGDFILSAQLRDKLPKRFAICMEINQSWDWNEYWTNDRYPDNKDYQTSSQPALVYKAWIEDMEPGKEYSMSIAGHSHYAGENGLLFEDIESLTTARQIAAAVIVRLKD
jgi:hypothetical protein